MLLTDLNDYVLIHIFKLLSDIDHQSLRKVCHRFEEIIEIFFQEPKCRDLLMTTHLKTCPRTLYGFLKYSERIRLNQNWMYGQFGLSEFFQHRENFLTHIELDENFLYSSNLGKFEIYARKKDGILITPVFSAGAENDSIIQCMKLKDEMLFGAKKNGSFFTHDDTNGYNLEFVIEYNLINDLDLCNGIFVSATTSDLRFHRLDSELDMLTFETIDLRTNFAGLNTITFNPTGKQILGSNGGNFYLIDSSTAEILQQSSGKPQIFNTQWIDEHVFLFTSLNSPVGLVDTRCGLVPTSVWGNFISSCLETDGRFGILCGTLLGMIFLFDLRSNKTFERVFHLDTAKICRSIKSDEIHMFVSTDNSIYLLNFD